MQFFGHILPVDGYQAEMNASLPIDYLDALIYLYQPLTGMEAIQLYQLLLLEVGTGRNKETETHHGLMNVLNLPLDHLYEARRKLEAIGLLQTYRAEKEDKVLYTYILLPPFRPAVFFGDVMLSELLYRQIGKAKFSTLKERYRAVPLQQKGENLTASFTDVFQSFTPDATLQTVPVKEEAQKGIPIQSVDFSVLGQSLQKHMIAPDKVFTELNRRLINQFATMYDMSLIEIEKSLQWALTDENELDIEQFKAACEDIFSSKQNKVEQIPQPEQEIKPQTNEKSAKPSSRTEEIIRHFERISPKHLLEDLSVGGNAAESDLQYITEITTKLAVPVPVMNVAIHYVMLRSGGQLNRKYLETIVSHWSRLGYQTAREAVNHVNKLYQEKPANKPRKQQSYRPRKQSNEVIPDWFKKRKEKQPAQKTSVEGQTLDEQERAELEALLKKHTSKNK